MFLMLWVLGIALAVLVIGEAFTKRSDSGTPALHGWTASAGKGSGSSFLDDDGLTSGNSYSSSFDDDWLTAGTGYSSGLLDDWSSSSIASTSHIFSDDDGSSINPATGLPMIGAIDIGGNPYGTDLHSCFDIHDSFSSLSHFDDSFSSASSFDSFSSGSSWDD